jgi:hypothetical protein
MGWLLRARLRRSHRLRRLNPQPEEAIGDQEGAVVPINDVLSEPRPRNKVAARVIQPLSGLMAIPDNPPRVEPSGSRGRTVRPWAGLYNPFRIGGEGTCYPSNAFCGPIQGDMNAKSSVQRPRSGGRRSNVRRPAAVDSLACFLCAWLALALLVAGCADPWPLKGISRCPAQEENGCQRRQGDRQGVRPVVPLPGRRFHPAIVAQTAAVFSAPPSISTLVI